MSHKDFDKAVQEIQQRRESQKGRGIFINVAVGVLIFAFCIMSGLSCVGFMGGGESEVEQAATQQVDPFAQINQDIANWKSQLTENPSNAVALANLGKLKIEKSQQMMVQAQFEAMQAASKASSGEEGGVTTLDVPEVKPSEEALALMAEAEKDLIKAVEKDPQLVFARRSLANYYMLNGDLEKVTPLFEEALAIADQIDPEKEEKKDEAKLRQGELRSFAFAGLGSVATQKGEWDKGLEYVDKAFKADPSQVVLLVNKAYILEKKGEKAKAWETLEQAELAASKLQDTEAQKYASQLRNLWTAQSDAATKAKEEKGEAPSSEEAK